MVADERAAPPPQILVALAASHRSHRAEPSQEIARSDAKRLFEAGKGGAEPVDEALLLELLSKRSVPQLRLTFSVYERIYGIGYTQVRKPTFKPAAFSAL